MKKLLVLVLLLAGCGYAGSQGYDWVNYQVQAPMSARSQAVTIHIDEGESPDQIAQDLKERLLPAKLENDLLFKEGYCGLARYLRDKKLNR